MIRAFVLELVLRLAAMLMRDDEPQPLPPNHRGDVHRRAREKRKELH